MDSHWKTLIRYVDTEGKICYGELDQHCDTSQLALNADGSFVGSLQAEPLSGTGPFDLQRTSSGLQQVTKILPILERKDVPIIKCIGLNYLKHIQEGGRTPPPCPSIFIKPSTSLAGFGEDIPIPKLAQDDQCDYEGELSIVIGKTGKNISAESALDHVLGYCASNDVSSRKWQRDLDKAGSVPQWCFSKGFDKYAPLGPILVSPHVVGAAESLSIQTRVNGDLRQDSNTSDMLFGVKEIIRFISQGTTLEAGTVIMTGTPSGVAFGMKPKPVWLKDGDIVEVKIEKLGSTKNRIVFE